MRLEHVGIAVNDPEEATDLLGRLLGLAPYQIQTVPSELVTTYFLSAGGTKLELLESLEENSAVGRFLAKRGQGVHHLAFEVDNLKAEMDRLRRDGFTLLNEVPKRGADGKHIFFVHPHDTPGLLIEFCQATHEFGAQWLDAPDPWGDWAEAGSPLAPRLLIAAPSLPAPGDALEHELARYFRLARPREPWSGSCARSLADLFSAVPGLHFAACLNVASALESGIAPLAPFVDRLGLRIDLAPAVGAGSALPPPGLVITEMDHLGQRRTAIPPGGSSPWVFAVPGDALDFCGREPRLVTDLVLRSVRSMSL